MFYSKGKRWFQQVLGFMIANIKACDVMCDDISTMLVMQHLAVFTRVVSGGSLEWEQSICEVEPERQKTIRGYKR